MLRLDSVSEAVVMLALAKMLVAWLLAIAAVTIFGNLRPGRRGDRLASWDSILGIGLVLGLPMLLLGLVISLSLSLLVGRNMAPVAAASSGPFLLAAAAWLIAAALPSGWKGAKQAMILFALIMGSGWGLLNLLVPPSPAPAQSRS